MKRYFLYTVILLALCSCTYDLLEKTIFIPDENDGNLPAYTEWGYNSFGAEYERWYFFATYDIVPCKVVYQDGILNFTLCGCIGPTFSFWSNINKINLTFSFPTSTIKDFRDLMILHKKEIDLTDSSCEVVMTIDSQKEVLSVLSGRLNFKRAQLLRLDDKENRVILSGIFNLQFLDEDMPVSISNGRFDLGIKDVFNIDE